MTEPSNCPKCNAALQADAKFCEACGEKLVKDPLDAYFERHENAAVSKARKWLAALAVLFAIFGTGYGFYAKSQADDAMDVLAGMPDSQTLTVEGETKTVAEWRDVVQREVYLVFAANYFLAAVMLGLFFWARKAPFPAMVTGLCVYLAVIVLNAAIDPKTLVQGIIIKIFFIGAMVSGIKAITAERDARRH